MNKIGQTSFNILFCFHAKEKLDTERTIMLNDMQYIELYVCSSFPAHQAKE